ncbi:unnamed protein product [Parajaminaea phylloscopi]
MLHRAPRLLGARHRPRSAGEQLVRATCHVRQAARGNSSARGSRRPASAKGADPKPILTEKLLTNDGLITLSESTKAKMSKFRSLMKTWYSPEVIPIYVITAMAVGGASWYLSRLARGPDVVWDRKNNPQPWNSIEPGTQTKLMSVNQEYEKKYKRDRL